MLPTSRNHKRRLQHLIQRCMLTLWFCVVCARNTLLGVDCLLDVFRVIPKFLSRLPSVRERPYLLYGMRCHLLTTPCRGTRVVCKLYWTFYACTTLQPYLVLGNVRPLDICFVVVVRKHKYICRYVFAQAKNIRRAATDIQWLLVLKLVSAAPLCKRLKCPTVATELHRDPDIC